LNEEIDGCRKAVVSHEFIAQSDTKEEALEKLKYYTGKNTCPNKCVYTGLGSCPDYCAGLTNAKKSCHKIACYARALSCPGKMRDEFYQESGVNKVNPDFRQFLLDAVDKYAYLDRPSSASS
jgi:hypothetical protein